MRKIRRRFQTPQGTKDGRSTQCTGRRERRYLLLSKSSGRKMPHSDETKDRGGADAASAPLVILEGKVDAQRSVAAKDNS
jgi:hypothetical protein